MNDLMKWLGKTTLLAVVWVFILSINVRGQPLFYHANNVIVQNAMVAAIDEELGDLWYRLSKTAKTTFNESEVPDEKAM